MYYCICLVGKIGANENNRTKTVFGAINKDYVGGAIDYFLTYVNVTQLPRLNLKVDTSQEAWTIQLKNQPARSRTKLVNILTMC